MKNIQPHFHEQSQRISKLSVDDLCVVRAQRAEPILQEDGSVHLQTLFDRSEGRDFRNTLHFTLNHKVRPHAQASWEESGQHVVIGSLRNVIDANGVPTALNTVDTWWTRDVDEPVIIPAAALVLKDTNLTTLISDLKDRKIFYKGENFSQSDLSFILADNTFDFPEKDSYKSLLKNKLEKTLEKYGYTLTQLLLTDNESNSEDLFSFLSAEDKISVEQSISGYLCRFACAKMISHLGYTPRAGGDFSWEDVEGCAHAQSKLAEDLGCPEGAKPHFRTIYAELENNFGDCREGGDTWQRIDEKTRSCIRKHKNLRLDTPRPQNI